MHLLKVNTKIKMMHKNKRTGLIVGLILSLTLMSVSFAETRYKVKSTDNLNRIIERYYQQSDLTRSQLLVGLLAKNQQAFRGGNINFLLRGKQLVLPDETDIATLSDEESKELLAEHTRYFKRGETGDFGSPIANGYLVSKSKKASVIENKQVLQTVKIDQLEKESDDLRKRLDKLIEEKNKSDAQLRKVEEALQDSLRKPEGGSVSESVESEEAKKKLDERVKKKIDGFQNINAEKTQVLNASEEVAKSDDLLSDGTKEITTKEITTKETSIQSIVAMLEQYYLPILGFLLFLFGWLFWNKNKKNRLIADEANIKPEIDQAYLEDKDFLNAKIEEEPLKDTVKIDMAVAYIDAGDLDSATDILNKLINEGSSAERKQAQKLLNSL